MKNLYDALNQARMEPDQYIQQALSSERQAELVARLLKEGGVPARSVVRRRAHRRWAALTAAALLTCGALGVGAASRFEWNSGFGTFLGIEQQQAEVLGVPGVGLNLTQPMGEGSVTLEGVLGDDHCVYLPFTVRLPESILPADAEDYGFDRFVFSSQDWGNSGAVLLALEQENASAGELHFLLMANTEANLSGKTATLTLADMFAYPCEPEKHRENALLHGMVEFTFRLDYQAQPVRVPVPKGKSNVGVGVALKQIELSPLSIYLGFENWPDDAFDSDAMLQIPVILHHTDGTLTRLVDEDHTGRSGQGVRYASGPRNPQVVYQFGEIIDPVTVQAIEVNGRFFQLDPA